MQFGGSRSSPKAKRKARSCKTRSVATGQGAPSGLNGHSHRVSLMLSALAGLGCLLQLSVPPPAELLVYNLSYVDDLPRACAFRQPQSVAGPTEQQHACQSSDSMVVEG